MNSRVNSRIFLLRSLGKSLSPYNKRYVKGSFGIYTYPSGVAVTQKLYEKISALNLKGRAKQQKVFYYLSMEKIFLLSIRKMS